MKNKKQKNRYEKLKRKLLFQALLITVLTIVVGAGILTLLIDGLLQGVFAEGVVAFFQLFHMDREEAIALYAALFRQNKDIFVLFGFISLFFVFFYIVLTRITKYLDQIGDGIENILSESSKPINLAPELRPIEKKLNTIKKTLMRRQYAAAESEQRKNDLVVFLAHDLKTPLTSIIAYLTVLVEEPDMPLPERAKYAQITLEKAGRLGELINEFFDITRFNLQDIVLQTETIDLSMMLAQILDEFYPVFAEHNLDYTVNTDESLMVKGDPDKLARVFDNLIRNAVSYSHPNTNIGVAALGRKDDILVEFSNESDEIPEEKLKVLFEKFYRVDNARSSQTGGAGLGLAIAKEIVELHGGTIKASCTDNRMKFQVVLPKMQEEKTRKKKRKPAYFKPKKETGEE